MAVLLISTIGPKTKNARMEPVVKEPAKDRAIKASTVEQTDSRTASRIRIKTESTGPWLNPNSAACGTTVCSRLASDAPSTKKRPISKNSSAEVASTCWILSFRRTGSLESSAGTGLTAQKSRVVWLSKLVGSFCRLKIKPVMVAINRVRPTRPHKTGPQPNATTVLISTIGLSAGAPSKKEIPTGTGRPRLIRRRVNGTTPHSQTGKNSPISEPTSAPSRGLLGTQRLMSWSAKNTSMMPEPNEPNKRKGEASMKMLKKMVVKLESRSSRAGQPPSDRLQAIQARISTIKPINTHLNESLDWRAGEVIPIDLAK